LRAHFFSRSFGHVLHGYIMEKAIAACAPGAEPAPPPLLTALTGDLLTAVGAFVGEADRLGFRLVCRAFRDHSSPVYKKSRKAFLRTRALTVFAWKQMPGFVIDGPGLRTMLVIAASVGCAGVLAELVEKRQCLLSEDACAAAAGKGHLGALAWLRSRGCPWDGSICCLAALGGHLEVLRYAHEHGCPWDEYICRLAAGGGHLEVLRYAHEHGCPWDGNTCYGAASGGHLEVLRYAHEHGCSWDSFTCWKAAEGGHLEMLRYAHEHGCPCEPDRCCAVAFALGHADVVEYLRAAGAAA
jgi:hypothetical protein